MFPIRDHNPSGRTPYVTWALIALNIVIFLLSLPQLGNETTAWRFFDHWGMVPLYIIEGHDLHALLTSMFLHGGWMHLLGNMLFLWIFGDNLEDEMGHGGLLLFYLAAGLVAAALQIAADPYSRIPMVGASGAIAGVMGGYLLLFPKARVDVFFFFIIFFRIFPIPAWIMLGIWFGLQLFSGVSDPGGMGGVAYWAHAGGFVAGLIMAVPLWLRRGGPAFWNRTAGQPPHPAANYPVSKSRVPAVRRR
ncbi:MAG: rhomboid family intramembrane serine protease [Cereibacter sphaeroides]|uniref:Rhomboid family intramembrane serine protease n=1 Tax=Cereibacter sphaeroides TaxID=1063 RepID=A0A2W5SLM4_CERSP|nr:MAG: rhomboid family intramembrane serine protease [Cereibacter sphaeroides]